MKLPTPRSKANLEALTSNNCAGILEKNLEMFHQTSVLLGYSYVNSAWLFSDSRTETALNETEINFVSNRAPQSHLAAFFDWSFFEKGRYWMAKPHGRAGILCKRPKNTPVTLITNTTQLSLEPMVCLEYAL